MLQSNWALPFDLIDKASSPDESAVDGGDGTKAETSAGRYETRFLNNLGVLNARLILG
jgi:hypothetical protein